MISNNVVPAQAVSETNVPPAAEETTLGYKRDYCREETEMQTEGHNATPMKGALLAQYQQQQQHQNQQQHQQQLLNSGIAQQRLNLDPAALGQRQMILPTPVAAADRESHHEHNDMHSQITMSERLLAGHDMNPEFSKRYHITSELGTGGFGFVCGAFRSADNLEVAVKFILKARITPSSYARDRDVGVIPMEVFILKNVNHSNIISYLDYYEDEKYAYLITEMHGSHWNASKKNESISDASYDMRLSPEPMNQNGVASYGFTPAAAGGNGVRSYIGDGSPSRSKAIPIPGSRGDNPPPLPYPHHGQNLKKNITGTSAPIELRRALSTISSGSSWSVSSLSVSMPTRLSRRPSMDLFECIEQHDSLSEEIAKKVFRQVALAVRHLHSRGVVHRDIKDENIVVDDNFNVRLIDFGSATVEPRGNQNHLFDRFYGTIQYAAPEILRGEKYCGRPTDIWALGVLLYTILCGEVPFASSEQAMQASIKPPRFRSNADALRLIAWMLELDPRSRPIAAQVCAHPWLR